MAQKILVVDDSPIELKLILAALQDLNCTIITADDGKKALKTVVTEKPDLIIMDVVMPNMNGFQACRMLKSSADFKQIPVVLLTKKNEKADEFWGKKQGADVYLTKPFEKKHLLDTIRKYLT